MAKAPLWKSVFVRCVMFLVPVAVVVLLRSSSPAARTGDFAAEYLPQAVTSWMGEGEGPADTVLNWPPVKGDRYPGLVLRDQAGNAVHLEDFEGRTILVELAAVSCQGCQAFSGGKQLGGFAGVGVQPGLESIHHYARQIAGVELGTRDVVFIQILLYGQAMHCPDQGEVSGWAEHFQLDRTPHTLVLQGDPSLLGPETMQMIPGFHLIDRQFILRASSCGHQPEDDLYRALLPRLRQLVQEQ